MTKSSRTNHMILADLQMMAEIFDPARTQTPMMQNIKESLADISTLRLEGFTDSLSTAEELSLAADYIVSILKHDPNITEIQLANNSFPPALARKICTAIAENENLEVININHVNLGSLSDTMPFLVQMASHPTAEELHMVDSIPAEEIRDLIYVTENQLPEPAKQFLAVSYLFEETHEEPIDYGIAQSQYLDALGTLEKKTIENQLMGTSEPFIVEYAQTVEEQQDFNVTYGHDAEEDILKTADFLSFASTSSWKEDDVVTPDIDEIELSSVTPLQQPNEVTPVTARVIHKLEDLEDLVTTIELYEEGILEDKLALPIQHLERLDISRLYNKLNEEDKEKCVHLLTSLASLKHHIKKMDLGHNHFSTEHLQTVLAAFAKAAQKEQRPNSLEKLSLHHAIDSKQLPTVASDLAILQSNLKRGVSFDPKRKRAFKEWQYDQDANATKQLASLKSACEDYLDYLERKIILPLAKEHKSLRDAYPGIENALNNTKIMKKIIHDLSSTEKHPIKALKNDAQFRMAIQKYRIIKSLENVIDDSSLSATAKKRQFDQRYYEKKVELPQLLLKNDKEQYNTFLKAIGDEKAITDIKTIGYAAKSRKPEKHFFEETTKNNHSFFNKKKEPTEKVTLEKSKHKKRP